MAGDASIGEKPSTNPITLSGLFTNIANALRAKKGTTTAIKAVDFPSSIQSLPVLDTSDATATAANILSGKTAYVKGAKVTGNIASKTASDLTASGAKVTVPAGHYASQATKSVATTTQATPSISVDTSGLITASATQTAGYVSAGTESATKQLTTQAAQTIMPGAEDKTIASGTYLTGVQTIKGDKNLVPGNIVAGVKIFDVQGSYNPTATLVAAEVKFSINDASKPISSKGLDVDIAYYDYEQAAYVQEIKHISSETEQISLKSAMGTLIFLNAGNRDIKGIYTVTKLNLALLENTSYDRCYMITSKPLA